MNINLAVIAGNVGNVEHHEGVSGDFTTLSVATQQSWKDDHGEWQSKTTWHNVFVPFDLEVRKGDQVLVRGRITKKQKDDGENYYVNIRADKIEINHRLRKAKEKFNGDLNAGGGEDPALDDEDIPF